MGKVRAVDVAEQNPKAMKMSLSSVSRELGKVPLTARMGMAPARMLRLW